MVQGYGATVENIMRLKFSHLPEKARRHYAAEESLKLDYGGVSYISRLLAIDRKTILTGKKELLSMTESTIADGRQRKVGGGRKKS